MSSLSPLVVLLVRGARRHPVGGDGGKQEDPVKCHICIWKTKPAISQAAHVFSCVKWIFFVGCDKVTLPWGQASRENRPFHALPWGPLQIQDFHLDVMKKLN